jgi:hypothetical protein
MGRVRQDRRDGTRAGKRPGRRSIAAIAATMTLGLAASLLPFVVDVPSAAAARQRCDGSPTNQAAV